MLNTMYLCMHAHVFKNEFHSPINKWKVATES